MIDGDLQDPPELIPEMLDALARAAPTSSTRVRASAPGETRFKLATARWFYRVFGSLAQVELAPDVGRLPADGPRARSTRCWRCPSATASCAG